MHHPAHVLVNPAPADVAHRPHTASVSRRILVADDSLAQRKVLAATLRRSGFEVFEAGDGDEALAVIRQYGLRLVLSDWMMPGLSGPELCKALRREEGGDYVYFILLTSKSERAEIASGLEQGADDFLTKPVNGDELRARIKAGLRILGMQAELSQKNSLLETTLDELRALYGLIESDLREARKLQEGLLRERYQDYGTAQVSLLLRSSGHVGGDLVGQFRASPTQVGLYAIDVSGHGIASALLTARLAGHLTTAAPEHNIALNRTAEGQFEVLPPEVVVTRFNRLMFDVIETDHYFTMCLALVDLTSGALQLTQAGHPHPIIQRGHGGFDVLGEGGLPVGLLENAQYDSVETCLEAGDRLLIPSDGLTECPAPQGGQLDEEGLAECLAAHRDADGQALLDALVEDLVAHHGGDAFPDDVSAVLFEFSGTGPLRP